MSTRMVWRRVPDPTPQSLGDELKGVLARRLWESDGTLLTDWKTVGSEIVPFLDGIIAASSGDLNAQARGLRDLIKALGQVQVAIDD